MKSVSDMSAAELAAWVQENLRNENIEVILSGGSCVSVLSDGLYVSMDIDLIHEDLLAPDRTVIKKVMTKLGFLEAGRYFQHPDTDIFVDFPPGPPAVGDEPVGRIDEMELSTGRLRLLSATDCVKDRLASYFYFDDQQSLQQAVMVAEDGKVDIEAVAEWAEREKQSHKFQHFKNLVEARED